MKKEKYIPPIFTTITVMMECTIANGSTPTVEPSINVDQSTAKVIDYKIDAGWENGASSSFEF